MFLNRFSNIERTDVIKFTIYLVIFFVLFFGYNNAISPIKNIEYNSAPEYINNKEVTVFDIGNKQITKPILTISFIPENISVDKDFINMLKLNINSSLFKNKVTPLYLIIDGKRIDPRGQISGDKLSLSSQISNDSEAIKVFVHELGHKIGLYYLKNKNPSLSDHFYNISWLDYNIKNKDAKIGDFVSGYALSNKYEDFAESFVFFVFHNEEFKKRANSNAFLKQKYDFFKDYVFDNSEFINTSFGSGSLQAYNWDSTKIHINLKKYLYYIR